MQLASNGVMAIAGRWAAERERDQLARAWARMRAVRQRDQAARAIVSAAVASERCNRQHSRAPQDATWFAAVRARNELGAAVEDYVLAAQAIARIDAEHATLGKYADRSKR